MAKRAKASAPAQTKREKKPELTYEQRLQLELEKAKDPPMAGPLLLSAPIFVPFVSICEDYLKRYEFAPEARNRVAFIAFHFRMEALRRFGHDTIETVALGRLLRSFAPPRGRPDSVSHIMAYPNMLDRFDAEEQSAAEAIQRIWEAFGKGLATKGSDMARVGSSGTIRHPVEVMDPECWQLYREVYTPWIAQASKLRIATRNSVSLTAASLVISVLVDDIYPEQLDTKYDLEPKLALSQVKRALKAYWHPASLAAAGIARRAPEKAREARQARAA